MGKGVIEGVIGVCADVLIHLGTPFPPSASHLQVLLLGGLKGSVVGRPLVPGATVVAEVQEHCESKDVIVAKFRRRKSSKRTHIVKPVITVLRIAEVNYEAYEDQI